MLMPDESQARSPKGDDSEYGTVVIGLLAPPQVPREFVEGLADELPGVLSERISERVSWEIPTVRDTRLPDVEYGEEGGEDTIDDVSEWRRHEGWDLAVCMTDLPLVRSDGRAVEAGASPRWDAALVSLPALGVIHRRRRALEEIVRLVSELRSDNVEPAREGEESRNGGTNGHTVSSDDENLQLVMPAEVSKVRLLAGMVRATHPFRVVLGLSYALTAALGTAAFTIITNTIWQLSGALGWMRLLALMLISLMVMVVYFIVVHDMWHRPSRRWGREYTVLLNATTVITLTIGALSFYAALFALTLAAAGLFIEGSVLGGAIGYQPGLIEYATLAWIVSSLATLGGTLGSGLEAGEDVREAAYTYHRERRRTEDGEGSD